MIRKKSYVNKNVSSFLLISSLWQNNSFEGQRDRFSWPQPKKLLDVMRHVCEGHDKPDKARCAIINKETCDGRRMQHYSDLLAKAIDSIITVKEESDIDSLFLCEGQRNQSL